MKLTRKIRTRIFALLMSLSSFAVAQDNRPNILLIIADDLGYTDMGAFGSEIPTPSLDALAYSGIRLTNFHTGQACQETRSMLMSGRGFSSVIQMNPLRADGERANHLRTDVATVPELLSDAGYRTYMAGKWDLGLTEETAPAARGFDRSFALLEASSSHFAEYFWDERSYYEEDGEPLALEDLPEDFYSTLTYTDKMLEYLEDHDGMAPWFGYVTYTSPHWPLQAPDDWLDRHAGNYDAGYDELRIERVRRATELGVIPEGASLDSYEPTAATWDSLTPELQRRYSRSQEIYASMIEFMDQQIGRLVEFLERTEQLDNTVILFMSDHGSSAAELGIRDGPSGMPPHFDRLIAQRDNALGNFGRIGSFIDHGRGFAEATTAPLRYFKGAVTEGGIRAAAFLHYPAALTEPGIDDTFITVMDILPTFLQIADVEHPGAVTYNGRVVQPVIGRSFWPHFTAGPVHGVDDAAGWTSVGNIGAIIRGRYKLTNQPRPGPQAGGGPPPWRLYDLEADPGEISDLANSNPSIVAELLQEWEADWR